MSENELPDNAVYSKRDIPGGIRTLDFRISRYQFNGTEYKNDTLSHCVTGVCDFLAVSVFTIG
jgi:hypothetical protein